MRAPSCRFPDCTTAPPATLPAVRGREQCYCIRRWFARTGRWRSSPQIDRKSRLPILRPAGRAGSILASLDDVLSKSKQALQQQLRGPSFTWSKAPRPAPIAQDGRARFLRRVSPPEDNPCGGFLLRFLPRALLRRPAGISRCSGRVSASASSATSFVMHDPAPMMHRIARPLAPPSWCRCPRTRRRRWWWAIFSYRRSCR